MAAFQPRERARKKCHPDSTRKSSSIIRAKQNVHGGVYALCRTSRDELLLTKIARNKKITIGMVNHVLLERVSKRYEQVSY